MHTCMRDNHGSSDFNHRALFTKAGKGGKKSYVGVLLLYCGVFFKRQDVP